MRRNATVDREFVPGLGTAFLTRLYDPVTRAIGVRSTHRLLVEQADLQVGHRVLEIGCGTGNVTRLAKRVQPGAEIHGLDPDPTMLSRARRKAKRDGLVLDLMQGYAERLPFPDATFDRVLSAYMFHHLSSAARPVALREARRVLRPGGSLHLLDFGGVRDQTGGWVASMMQRNERLRDNYDDRIPTLMTQAGLINAAEIAHRVKWFGRVAYYRAVAPA